jgi:hypothetical protein
MFQFGFGLAFFFGLTPTDLIAYFTLPASLVIFAYFVDLMIFVAFLRNKFLSADTF